MVADVSGAGIIIAKPGRGHRLPVGSAAFLTADAPDSAIRRIGFLTTPRFGYDGASRCNKAVQCVPASKPLLECLRRKPNDDKMWGCQSGSPLARLT